MRQLINAHQSRRLAGFEASERQRKELSGAQDTIRQLETAINNLSYPPESDDANADIYVASGSTAATKPKIARDPDSRQRSEQYVISGSLDIVAGAGSGNPGEVPPLNFPNVCLTPDAIDRQLLTNDFNAWH